MSAALTICEVSFLPFDLPGSCAPWFSGGISTIAVIVALSGYFIAEVRTQKEKKEQNSEELSGLSIMLSNILDESLSFVGLFEKEVPEFEIGTKKYRFHPELGAIPPGQISNLDKKQARFLLSHGLESLAHNIRNSVNLRNTCVKNLEEYNRNRREFTLYYNNDFKNDILSTNGLHVINARMNYLHFHSKHTESISCQLLEYVISLCEQFNKVELGFVDAKLNHKIDLQPAKSVIDK